MLPQFQQLSGACPLAELSLCTTSIAPPIDSYIASYRGDPIPVEPRPYCWSRFISSHVLETSVGRPGRSVGWPISQSAGRSVSLASRLVGRSVSRLVGRLAWPVGWSAGQSVSWSVTRPGRSVGRPVSQSAGRSVGGQSSLSIHDSTFPPVDMITLGLAQARPNNNSMAHCVKNSLASYCMHRNGFFLFPPQPLGACSTSDVSGVVVSVLC